MFDSRKDCILHSYQVRTVNSILWLMCRAELGLADSYYHTSAGQRERLLTASERLHKTSDKIQEGRKQLLETEVGF